MSRATIDAEARNHALAHLRSELKPGDTLYTVVRHVTGSGMCRWIDVYHMENNQPVWLSRWVAKAIGRNVNNRNHDGVECHGCGMDMGFDLVYSLGAALWPDGFRCIGEGCPANDHVNDRKARYVTGRTLHRSGGYALNQRWL